ncbi:hypothetical protein A0H81_12349 [Grifola frondosa]|uniref:CUE domain-containing protein n=1 Tax=Grifola frondosa TaxID=5627 RepID=A0A1C7LT35_GRIFR|nr:hypothetical protein A0H81_12349 [Grifola frondosa]
MASPPCHSPTVVCVCQQTKTKAGRLTNGSASSSKKSRSHRQLPHPDRTILDDIASVPTAGAALAAQCEPAFEIIFALLDLQSAHTTSATERATPFLNRPLLADYQDAYDLSHTLSDVLRRADDVRTELLESTLRSLDASPSGPGALKLVLRSSGIPPGIDDRGNKKYEANSKGKERQVEPPTSREDDQALDIAVSQVLDILPDQEPSYIRFLLSHRDYPYQGNAERLIEALLEGTAPRQEDVEIAMKAVESVVTPQSQTASRPQSGTFEYTKERRNVFDEDVMDLTKVRIGKKSDDTATVLQDRSFIEQMKADILRRAEEISDEEDEEDVAAVGTGKGKGQEITFEEELDEDVVKVRDGEESEDGQDDMEGEDGDIEEPAKTQPETILELAYLRDPKLFDRDGQTRRSKARADLKAQTGWSDEQIEGWKIMLERNPKKDQILSKHEFSGNKALEVGEGAEGEVEAEVGGEVDRGIDRRVAAGEMGSERSGLERQEQGKQREPQPQKRAR